MDIAAQNRLPSISLIESGGADLPNQSKIFVPGGRGFRDLTRRSAERIPTICLVFGSSTAGGAYIPGMSDYVVMVKKQAQVFLGGPAAREDGDRRGHRRRGARRRRDARRVSGVSDYLARDERDAIRLGREIVAHLDWRKLGWTPSARPIEEPRYDPEELLGIASPDVKVPFDAREVIARIVDGSRFSEFKPRTARRWSAAGRTCTASRSASSRTTASCSPSRRRRARSSSSCATRATCRCCSCRTSPASWSARRYEQDGIIKHGAKLINAVSNSTVPAITIMTGASYGAGNYAMSGRAYAPRFLFTWPNHRIAVMGGKQLAGVLDIIQRDAAAEARRGRRRAEARRSARR